LLDEDGQLPLFVASTFGHCDIVILLTAHEALHEENVKAQYKTFSKGTKDKVPAASTTLLNPCGYSEEEISHSKEKQGEEKDAICIPKVQEGKEERILTREMEETEEIIYQRETKKEKYKKKLRKEKNK
jgi:hypothetical protein